MAESRRLNFTKAALAALPPAPAGKRVYVHDNKTKGLVLAITDRGVKSFQLYRWVNKRPERLTLGRFDDNGLTVEQARKAVADHNLSIARGENPAQAKRTRNEEMTLRDLFDEYLVRQASVNRRLDKHQQTFRLYLSHWAGRRLSEITHDAVSRWHKALPAKIAQASIEARRERERLAARAAKKEEDKAKAAGESQGSRQEASCYRAPASGCVDRGISAEGRARGPRTSRSSCSTLSISGRSGSGASTRARTGKRHQEVSGGFARAVPAGGRITQIL